MEATVNARLVCMYPQYHTIPERNWVKAVSALCMAHYISRQKDSHSFLIVLHAHLHFAVVDSDLKRQSAVTYFQGIFETVPMHARLRLSMPDRAHHIFAIRLQWPPTPCACLWPHVCENMHCAPVYMSVLMHVHTWKQQFQYSCGIQ